MNALLLVGGSGSRLRPLTDHLPKPMIPVMGTPLLERTCTKLRDAGVDQLVMSVCYKPGPIVGHFGNGNSRGLTLYYVLEDEPLGTGGALKRAQNYLPGRFIACNADVLCDVSFEEMLRFHEEGGADATIAATWVADPSAYGVIEHDWEGRIRKFTEKPPPGTAKSHYVNAGIYVFEREVLDEIERGRPVSLEREVFPRLLEQGKTMLVYRDTGYWADIGTPQSYYDAHEDIFDGRCGVVGCSFGEDGIHLDPSALLPPPSYLEGPLHVGRGVRMGTGCKIGPGVVLGDGAVVGAECVLRDCNVWPGTHISGGSHYYDCILAEVDGKLRRFPYEELNIQTKERQRPQ